jgi:hypothetical protein
MGGASVTAATEPRSWTMLGDVETCLQRIRRADGFFTDAGAYVTREPKPITTRGQIVVGIIWDGKRRAENDAMRRGGFLNGFTIAVRMEAGRDDAQLTLHSIIDDVEKAIDGQRATFNSNTTYPQFESMQVIPQADGQPWIGADLLYTNHSKPRST